MPGNDDHDELSAQDLAALQEYENSKEGQAKSAPDPAVALTKLFNNTPEMQECITTAGSINNRLNPDDTVAVQIDVPREFMRLTEFLEQKRALASGVEPLPPREVLNQVLLNELHDQLHWLITGPDRFRYYRELWNRFCDQQDAPHQKIPDPLASTEGGGEAPFSPF